ncbi:MAG: hypothetical protein ABS939_20875 [Psychrobacillus sp.]
MLAEQINMNQGNSMFLEKPGAVFSALSFPAYISMDVLLTLNGFEVSGEYNLKVILNRNTDSQALVQGQFFIEDEVNVRATTSTHVINLRKVPIREEGVHQLTVLVDDKEVAKANFDVIQDELD